MSPQPERVVEVVIPPAGFAQRLAERTFLRRLLPASAFFGGFLWDAVTLGRVITRFDLILLLGYYLAAGVILVLIGREVRFRFSDWLNVALQFFFGGIFSALVIFYFLSSGELGSFLLVLLLAALLVGNELLESHYSRLTLSWTFFAFCGIMVLNFALPHLFRTISTFWFYASTLVALLMMLAARRLSGSRGSVGPAIGVAAVLVLLHAVNVIPPVPLVKKEMLIAHEVTRREGVYVMSVEPPPSWKFWRRSADVYHRPQGAPVYCFTSVFVPKGIETTLVHVWERWNQSTRSWAPTDRLRFRIAGGRQEGYRGYTVKQNMIAGDWRVRAEAESGATVGLLEFRIEPADGPIRTRRLVR
ncbi:MAG TPA: DUF2914 domain-containing protein [Thermoanaerobaculia bacterium]|nr:DUF2914 domain-containing protein [Thermoanaerobaculia bacterium]